MPSPSDRPARDKDHSQLVDAARADLAGRIDADPADIQVDRVMDVTWRDGSMGCPEPGQMYTQALVDGAYIELIHDGDSYAYHWGIHLDDPFLCEQSDGPPDDHAEY